MDDKDFVLSIYPGANAWYQEAHNGWTISLPNFEAANFLIDGGWKTFGYAEHRAWKNARTCIEKAMLNTLVGDRSELKLNYLCDELNKQAYDKSIFQKVAKMHDYMEDSTRIIPLKKNLDGK